MAKKEGGKVRINSIKLHLIGNVYIYSYLIHVTKFFFSSHISNILRKKKNKNKNKAQHPLALGTIPVLPIFYRKKKTFVRQQPPYTPFSLTP